VPEHTPDYVAALAAAVEQASEFRVPCPGHPYSHRADLRVKRRTDGYGNGWAVLNDNPGNEQAWTGAKWVPRGELSRPEIYRYDRQTALDEATRIAPLETAAFLEHIARLRAQHKEGAPSGH
jgi:hypothetical protein